MNEKKFEKKNYFMPSTETRQESELARMMGMLSSLENRARVIGALAVLRTLYGIRKTMESGNPNKKVIRATLTKLEKIKAEIIEYQQRQMTR